MATFFFHFFDGNEASMDEWGVELEGAEQAYLEAAAAARSMWAELVGARTDPMDCQFQVTDANGEELFRLEFSELVDGGRPAPGRPVHSSEIVHHALHETHRRASSAKAELRSTMDDVYRSLAQSNALIRQLSAFEKRGR